MGPFKVSMVGPFNLAMVGPSKSSGEFLCITYFASPMLAPPWGMLY